MQRLDYESPPLRLTGERQPTKPAVRIACAAASGLLATLAVSWTVIAIKDGEVRFAPAAAATALGAYLLGWMAYRNP